MTTRPQHPQLPALLQASLFGLCLIASGCAEEPPRPPSPAVRCAQLKRTALKAREQESRMRAAWAAMEEGCLIWRDTLTDGQQK